jgi:hypothetical protein
MYRSIQQTIKHVNGNRRVLHPHSLIRCQTQWSRGGQPRCPATTSRRKRKKNQRNWNLLRTPRPPPRNTHENMMIHSAFESACCRSEIIWLAAGQKRVWRLLRMPKKKTPSMTSQSFAFFRKHRHARCEQRRTKRSTAAHQESVLGLRVGANAGGTTPKRAK